MTNQNDIVAIIPVLNEECTIAEVIEDLRSHGLIHICVVDNGSNDNTAHIAAAAGAQVVTEPHRGYGQACWRGLETLMAKQAAWILFCDGDGSDDPKDLPRLLAQRKQADLILGNRRGTPAGRSQLTPVQNFGNWLATRLIWLGWSHEYQDLGPLRLIRRQAIDQLAMTDRGFGWTVEMQAKAAAERLRIRELPVNYRPRQGGKSKISGTLTGSAQAGCIILTTLGRLYLQSRATCAKNALIRFKQFLHNSERLKRSLPFLSIVLLVAGSLWAVPHGDFLNQPTAVPLFWRGVVLMGVGFVFSWGLTAVTGRWFWLGAIAPRLVLLAMHPGDDIWRYLWEGHIQTVGLNPYVLAPNAPELAPLRFDWWPMINHLDHAAIYPPVAQLGFRLLAAIAPSALLFKSAFVAADLCICWLLSRRFGYRPTLLYAWNPLIIYSFAGGGHYDSWFLLPLVAAWLWADPAWAIGESHLPPNSNHWKSAIAIGISIATKWMSLPVLVFLAWQYRYRSQLAIGLLLVGLLPLALASLPFCQRELFGSSLGALSCPVLPLNSSFVNYGRSATFIPAAVAQIWPASEKMNGLYALPLGGVLLWQLWRTHKVNATVQIGVFHSRWSMLHFNEHYLFALMLLSPIVHAWYFTWLVPFSVVSRNWGTQLVSLSAFLYFAMPHSLAVGGEWRLNTWQYWGLWGAFLLGLAISLVGKFGAISNSFPNSEKL